LIGARVALTAWRGGEAGGPDVQIDMRVAELICSRLCHELVNPVGAVNNGVELLAEIEGTADPEALSLIGQSAKTAALRLQFYRLAYGQAAGSSVELTLAEAGALVQGVVGTNRVQVSWPESGPESEHRPGRAGLKMLLNLSILAAEALPRGGRVALGLTAEPPGSRLTVTAEGEQAALAGETLAAFKGELAPEVLSARTVHGYFTGRLSAAVGLPVDLERSAGRVGFRVILPPA
jgi:histidine phosphotransferase ChpT